MQDTIKINKFSKKATLTYCYSVMRGGKSAKLVTDRFRAIEEGLKTIIIKPSVDTRDGKFVNEWGVMRSRAFGEQEFPAYYTQKIDLDFIKKIILTKNGHRKYHRIFIDEAQFFSPKDIAFIACEIVHGLKIPVKAYGLFADVNADMFPGTSKLLVHAHNSFEIPYDCEMHCGNPAKAHIRFIDGKVDTSGQSVVIEQGHVEYMSVCRDCWQDLMKKGRSK